MIYCLLKPIHSSRRVVVESTQSSHRRRDDDVDFSVECTSTQYQIGVKADLAQILEYHCREDLFPICSGQLGS